jgi:hypothetical protein
MRPVRLILDNASSIYSLADKDEEKFLGIYRVFENYTEVELYDEIVLIYYILNIRRRQPGIYR